ncbi:hypothetical protein H4582DRAFT_2078348 [Lactarius indigo]|nr:hypothetical protein H4582DRAFT_2078348 [Lactarius indigo]
MSSTHAITDCVLIAVLMSKFPSLTNTTRLFHSMNAQSSFKEGEPSKQVTMLLKLPLCFTLLDTPVLLPVTLYISPQYYQSTEVGSVTTAFKLVVAAIKTCQEARLMCSNAGTPKMSGFISNVYLEKTLKCLENYWVGAGGMLTSPNRVPLPTTPSYRDIAMSPPLCGPMIRIKWPALSTDIATSKISEAPMGTDSMNQPTATTEPTRPSVGLDEGAHASAMSLRLLQVSELLAWFRDNNISAPKGKCKDDLIAAIVKSPEFASISESTIKEIIEKRKKKGSQKPLAALP